MSKICLNYVLTYLRHVRVRQTCSCSCSTDMFAFVLSVLQPVQRSRYASPKSEPIASFICMGEQKTLKIRNKLYQKNKNNYIK